MTSTLHWLRDTSLTDWLTRYRHLLGEHDALLLSGNALTTVPEHSPVANPVFLKDVPHDQKPSPLSQYKRVRNDIEWVELTLRFEHQITW